MSLLDIAQQLSSQLNTHRFSNPVRYVYNPFEYAFEGYRKYVLRYGEEAKTVVFVGMNPGPWGMVQTGVPFGDVPSVRDWLGISAEIRQPSHLHPKRPVMGFKCHRSEVSGTRVWGWAKSRFGDPESFFRRCFIANYCPLAFFDEAGRNITPDKLRKHDRDHLFTVCDRAILETVKILDARYVIGFGTFVYRRLVDNLLNDTLDVSMVTHPSPANPRANKGWQGIMDLHPVIQKVMLEVNTRF